jgi:hypothetical protein
MNLLATPDIFRDMSGREEVSKLLDALISGTVDLAKAREMAKNIASKTKGATTMEAKQAPSESDASDQIDKLDAIRYGKDAGLIDEEEASDAATGVLGGGKVLLASADAGFVPDAGTALVYWSRPEQKRTVEIDGNNFDFEPKGNGATGTIDGPLTHNGAYKILKNKPGSFEMDVNVGTDSVQTNDMAVKLVIQGDLATLTGKLQGKDLGADGVIARVRGTGTRANPFIIKFTSGTLKWF